MQQLRCISFDSYIKPQRLLYMYVCAYVVYLLIPTSNHNLWKARLLGMYVVYLLIPTSNHNLSNIKLFHTLLYIF